MCLFFLECQPQNFLRGKIVMSFGAKNVDVNNVNKSPYKVYHLANQQAALITQPQINSKIQIKYKN